MNQSLDQRVLYHARPLVKALGLALSTEQSLISTTYTRMSIDWQFQAP